VGTEALMEAARGLFSICAIAAAMELLSRDERTALSFRSVCALATCVCVLRAIIRWVGNL